MEIAIKNILDDKLRKDFEMKIPSQIISQKVNDHIAKIKPEFSLEGFQKGNVPVEIIKEKYGKTFMAEQSDIIISEALSKIINDNKYKIASTPKIEFKAFEDGKDIDLIASFEIFPLVPEIDFSQIKLNKYKINITKQDIEEATNKTLRSKMNWVKQDQNYLTQFGDIAVINYSGSIDGKPFDGSDGKDFQLELGTKTFVDNFEDQLIGKAVGQETQVSVAFPNDYFRPALSGKKAIFIVTITSILKAEKANFDNDFVKKATGFEDLSQLQDAILNQMSFNYDSTCRAIFKKDLFDYLDANYAIEIPTGLVNDQINFLKNINAQNNPQAKATDSQKELKLSQRMVRCGLILADMANKNNIQVTQQEIDNEINNVINLYPDQKEQIMENYKNNPQSIQQLIGAILEEKAVNFIVNKINITEIEANTKQIDRIWFDISNN